MATDTERLRRLQEELKTVNEVNEALLKALPFPMDIVDENGVILYMSKKFADALGRDVVGKRCWDIYKDDRKQCAECPLKKGVPTGREAVSESAGVLGGRYFQIAHVGMTYGGKKAIMEIFIDITERKKIEGALRESGDELQKKVRDLEKFNKFAVDRELKMVELKGRIRELEAKSGGKA